MILLGDTGCEACQKVKDRFFELLAERGLDGSIVAVLDGALTMTPLEAGGYDSRKPTFAYYFGKQDHGDKDVEELQKLMGNGDAVFPIFFTDGQFQQEIPAVLHPINGKLYTDGLLDSIVNVAFEELRLLRKVRRVFISYKRSDSATIANQLYDVLSRHQFDVFLDTYSIRGAADFQAELHHRITDSDVLIQLNSPNFMDSDWCKEEISEANARQVGVLQLNWPGADPGSANQLCTIRNIETGYFSDGNQIGDDATLKAAVLEDIAMTVEALRARNIAARQDGLTAEFVKEAERQGRAIVKEPMFLVEQRQDGKLWYYIPIIGVPQSMDCYESQEMLKQWLPKDKMPEKVSLIYDDMRILPKWIAHLDWMREYMIVKTIKKQEFELWLKTTK